MTSPPATDSDARAPSRRSALDAALAALADVGSAAQASIPGFYAWGVTVAPAAWGRGGSLAAKGFALLGLAALVGGIMLERARPRGARAISVWGLSIASALVWALAPASMAPVRLDLPRAISGMLGWGLFAFTSAAPALRRDPALAARVVEGAPLRPRTRAPRGDTVFMVTATVAALVLQTIGWSTTGVERAILVRLVCLAAGLGVVGAGTSIALARHGRRMPTPTRTRLREGLPWIALLAVLGIAGALLEALLRG